MKQCASIVRNKVSIEKNDSQTQQESENDCHFICRAFCINDNGKLCLFACKEQAKPFAAFK